MWCALLYAGAASYLSWRVGRPLINLNAEHYAREAEFRFALVRINEHIDGITLYGGEADERRRLNGVFGSVLDISRQIVNAVTRLTWVTAGYGWFTIIAPILVAAPAYFRGTMSFGELMVIVGAFNQVQTALRWFVDNFSNLADWRATLLRVARFRKAIMSMDELGQATSRIQFAEADGTVDQDRRPSRRLAGGLRDAERTAREHEPQRARPDHRRKWRAKSRAVSRHRRPLAVGKRPNYASRASQPIMFMPVRAYIPPGTLRAAVAYPHPTEAYDAPAIVKALAAVGLEHLEPHLDTGGPMGPGVDRRREAMPGLCPRHPAKAGLGCGERRARRPRSRIADAHQGALRG